MIKTWLDLHDVHPTDWGGMVSVKEWWRNIASRRSQSRRALLSLMLLSWEIWNEQNARVFHSTAIPVGVLVTCVKAKTSLWCLAGAKYSCNIMPRE